MNEPNATVRGTALLTKALDIVELISDSDNRLKFKDIAERTGHSKSTLYRILSALSARGMIDIDQRDQSYVLGPKFTEMAGSINSSSDLIAVSAGPLKSLADQHGESVNLSILLGTAQVTISRWQGRLAQPFHSPLGERKPLYATGLGKCLLSFLPENERETLMSRMRLTAYTKNTITDLDKLREDIEITRVRGFAMDDNEIIEGVVCVSTPILSADGRPLASVSLTGPAHRFTDTRRLELASVLQMTTRRISQLLVPQHTVYPSSFTLPGGGSMQMVDARAFSSRALGDSAAWGGFVWLDGPGGRLMVERAGDSVVLIDLPQIHAATLGADGELLFASDGRLMRMIPGTTGVEKLHRSSDFDNISDMAVLSPDWLLVMRAGQLRAVPMAGGASHAIASDLDGAAGFSVNTETGSVLVVRATDNAVLSLGLNMDDATLISTAEVTLPAAGKVTGLCHDRSGKIWIAYMQSWSLCLCDGATGKSQHFAVPLPSLQGLAPGSEAGSVLAGSDRLMMSQSLIEAAPAAGGLVRITV